MEAPKIFRPGIWKFYINCVENKISANFDVKDMAEDFSVYFSKPSWKSRDQTVVRYAIWYHLRNLKNVKNTHGRVLILVKLQAWLLILLKLQASACKFTKINTPP